MPVFDFSNTKTEKKDPECTYTTFQSNEKYLQQKNRFWLLRTETVSGNIIPVVYFPTQTRNHPSSLKRMMACFRQIS